MALEDPFLINSASKELRIVKLPLYPSRWQKFCEKYQLTWDFTLFESNHADQVPEEPGLYCFYIGHDFNCLPKFGLCLYGGITKRTLRIRFKEYVREQNRENGRPWVKKFLKVFQGELSFGWTIVENSTNNLSTLEKEFNDAMMPPYSIRNFSAEVSAERNMWQ